MAKIQIIVPVAFTCDTVERAEEYGMTETEAEQTFRVDVADAVRWGSVVEALETQWPAMKGYIHVLDNPDEALPAYTAQVLSTLDTDTSLEQTRHLIRDENDRRESRKVIEEIRAYVAQHQSEIAFEPGAAGRTVVGVILQPDEYDSGWYFEGTSLAVLEDGTTVELNTGGAGFFDRISDLYGSVPPGAGLGVDLRDAGSIRYDDSWNATFDAFGVPEHLR